MYAQGSTNSSKTLLHSNEQMSFENEQKKSSLQIKCENFAFHAGGIVAWKKAALANCALIWELYSFCLKWYDNSPEK